MTYTSTQTILPTRVIRQLQNMPMGFEEQPSHTQRVIVEGSNSGDPRCFQTKANITQVDAPLSMIQQETLEFRILTGIWKVTEAGRGGCSDHSKSKTIKRSYEGSTAPMVVSRDFHYEGNDWRSSSVEMAARDCTKSSTILYEWEAFPEEVFQRNGPLGILI